MTAPVRAPKKPKNQPRPFHETMAPSLPMAAPAAPAATSRPRLSDRQMRISLTIIWVAVMILVGGALGLKLLTSQADNSVPGVPVASAQVKVASLPRALPIVKAPTTTYTQPTVVTAGSVNQATSGNPFKVIRGTAFQPTDGPDATHPGYQTTLRLQGNQGISPVR